jgi:hypothetical protein
MYKKAFDTCSHMIVPKKLNSLVIRYTELAMAQRLPDRQTAVI